MITTQEKFSDSFFQNDGGQWTLRTGVGGLGSSFDVPSNAKWVRLTQTSLADTYSFYTDNTEATLLKSITITYTSSSKETIATVGVSP